MRLDSESLGGPAPTRDPAPLDAREARLQAAESALESREAALRAELQALETERAAIASLVVRLGQEGVAVDEGWRGVIDPSRVGADPAVEVAHAQAMEARRAAVEARERAAQAREADLQRRAQASSELLASARELASRARAALEGARAQKARAAAPPPPPKPAPASKPKPPPAAEQRQHERRAFQAQVDFESDHNFFTGFSSDISEGGLFIATVDVLPIGARLDVSFSIGAGAPVTVGATVRWVREILDDARVMPGMGVQFDPLPELVRGAIHQFIDAREPMFFD